MVYKASAGSGKTFRLAVEYIKLLIKNPLNYRNILAVTFTNKATEEMKLRILEQLQAIWRREDKAKAYLEIICNELDISPAWASERAGISLHLLLHHYSYFRIETIDSFFQSVLRNLARELDLTPNLSIEMNDEQVINLAVDHMIEQLTDKDKVLHWIMNYINENIREDKSWNIIKQLKTFAKTILKDFYKEESKNINKILEIPNFFESYSKDLRQQQQEAKEIMLHHVQTFNQLLNEYQLTIDDFANKKSGVCGIFLKLQEEKYDSSIITKRSMQGAESSEVWITKNHPRRNTLLPVIEEKFIPLLQQLLHDQPIQWSIIQSTNLTLKHLHQLRLLGKIETSVREMNSDANRFLLSDTHALLRTLIQENDSPFIFEKIGGRLDHIMIDEFQDTGNIQWKNFKVLLEECMSHHDSQNLIVGDVKQSIYRWRAGDWQLLNDIDRVFASHAPQMAIKTLCTNRRSQRRIIQFNNALFTAIAQNESKEIAHKDPKGALSLQKAYSDVVQEIPKERDLNGYIELTLLPNNEDYDSNTLDILTSRINEILAKGYSQGSIAILVRANRFIPVIAARIKRALPQVNIISDEAFRLDASLAVNTIVTAMKYMADTTNELALAFLVNAYQYGILHRAIAQEDMFKDEETALSYMPENFITSMEHLCELPLPDMVDRLYALYELYRLPDEGAYVCALHDCIMEYTETPPADLSGFIKEWDSTYAGRTIQSDGVEGIHILSIHKSKGLEYDHILLPYCDWQIESYHADNVVWCKPTEEPYNRMPLVPVDFSKNAMNGTIYEGDYLTEHLQNTVDNLNLLYVALTRACRSLTIIGKKEATSTRSYSIEQALEEVQKALPGSILNVTCHTGTAATEGCVDLEEGEAKKEAIILKYGELEDAGSPSVDQTDHKPMQHLVEIQVNHSKAEYKQSNKSIMFLKEEKTGTDTDAPSQNKQQMYIHRGSVLHQLMANINTYADIKKEIRLLESEGVLDADIGMTTSEIEALINSKLQQPEVKQWFDGTWALHNECSIITQEESSHTIIERRPDRVMSKGEETVVLDFKFGKPMTKHQTQVQEYVNLLEAMGYKHVKGYLWYVFQDLIISL